jgi:hypothetical protein
MQLSEKERGIVIRALTKVLETEPPYARADEYKKLLDRLKREEMEDEEREEPLKNGLHYFDEV